MKTSECFDERCEPKLSQRIGYAISEWHANYFKYEGLWEGELTIVHLSMVSFEGRNNAQQAP